MNKRIILRSLTFMLVLFFQRSYSQQYTVLKINMLGAVKNKLGISLEQSLSKKMSAVLGFESGLYVSQDEPGSDTYKVTGYSYIPEIRFYPDRGNKAFEGFFLGLCYRYLKFTEQSYQNFNNRNNLNYLNIGTYTNIGFELGYKFSHRRFWAEGLFSYGDKGNMYFDYESNAYLSPFYTFRNDVFLKNVQYFTRFEISAGYILYQSKNEK